MLFGKPGRAPPPLPAVVSLNVTIGAFKGFILSCCLESVLRREVAMYARRLKCANQRWKFLFEFPNCSIRSYNHNHLNCGSKFIGTNQNGKFSRRYLLELFPGQSITVGMKTCTISGMSKEPPSYKTLRFYSNGKSSEDEHVPVVDKANFDKTKVQLGEASKNLQLCDEHARLSAQDQMEWINNEKAATQSIKRESPFLKKKEKLKNYFMQKIIPWERINVSWETFPYYIHKNIKNHLVESAASHLKHNKIAAAYGSRLRTSTGRLLLQSIQGTELYRERLVRALAKKLRVPVLVLGNSILASTDFSGDYALGNKFDDEQTSGMEQCTSELEADNENDADSNEYASSSDSKSDAKEDGEIDSGVVEILKKLVPNLEEFLEYVSEESKSLSKSLKPDDVQESDKSEKPLRKGDHVKYIGPSARARVEADNRILLGKISTTEGPTNAYTVIDGRDIPTGQHGEVYEVDGEHVAVILDIDDNIAHTGVYSEKTEAEHDAKPSVCWIHVKDIERDPDAQHECYIALEALYDVLQNKQPLIVYFPDSTPWLSRTVPKSSRKEFISKVQKTFDQLSGPILLIFGQNKVEIGSKKKGSSPTSLRRLTEGLKVPKRREDDDKYNLFTNVLFLDPPKEEELLRTFNKQIEEDRRIVISRRNLIELHMVLAEHELSCNNVLHVQTGPDILTKQKAEKVVGWAINHHLSSCLLPSIEGGRLAIPRKSLEIAIVRLHEQESFTTKPSQGLKNLAKGDYERNFISAVVPPGEVGVRFDDIGALEDVKKALNELVILPMRRPELFSRGNLLRPCKGILLFGPPGTGKTLLAKALATEAGATFISITGSTLMSKWFGDAEKLTKALFSFASKLAPVIIFVDEVDSLLGARGGASEQEATRRMRNEFMAAWDGLRTKDTQRILILGATNRPFDLDDAVIRRLPRRIYVDLPDAENRKKILKVILSHENLAPDFEYDKLANAAEGYSGSDLKNLCIAAAYRPVQELLEAEKKVGPSVSYDASSMDELRKWNERYGEGGSRRQSPFGF
ncbi:LOW QUALITY PROTEIN: hypothetical protein V2J09_004087 [Rumex salicifolius]